MTDRASKLSYFVWCAGLYAARQRLACSNCGAVGNPVVDRKLLVSQLRRCKRCRLQYRTPAMRSRDSEAFYENDYDDNFVSQMPSRQQLEDWLKTDFAGTSRDYTFYLDVLRRCGLQGEGKRVLDFGCSWGYGSYQLQKVGYSVVGYEIAPSRRKFAAQELGIRALDSAQFASNYPELTGTFDCFFSSHVLEHVPAPSDVVKEAQQLLSSGGLFVSFTPNGSARARNALPYWSKYWGKVHPNFIDEEFLENEFRGWPKIFASSESKQHTQRFQFPAPGQSIFVDSLAGPELVFVARKP